MTSIPVLDLRWCLEALKEVNQKVAAAFAQPAKDIRFTFVDQIKEEIKNDRKYTRSYLAGQADLINCEVKLLSCRGWQETAVHELVHIYKPHLNEKEVLKITQKVIKYLVSFRNSS